ncbi:hypothetical protein OG978_45690 (plasmid) [Streptomyces sp. NBC_01591]|nr:hypothetical protein [Streptomyces sp. NBC_01591]WSD74354.1 hypothetical protein OG978_45690 [Streptomyces sp. NBC_01591]
MTAPTAGWTTSSCSSTCAPVRGKRRLANFDEFARMMEMAAVE